MKLKRALPVLGVFLFLMLLLAVSACNKDKNDPAETNTTGDIGAYESSPSTLPPVTVTATATVNDTDTEPSDTDAPTEPVTMSATEPVTQPPVKEPETLSAEEESILDALYSSLQSASAAERVLCSSATTVTIDAAGAGSMSITESSQFICADGNYSTRTASGDIQASVTLYGNFLYTAMPSGDKMKAYLTTAEERELVVSGLFSGYALDEGMIDRSFLDAVRGVKRTDGDEGTVITFDSMDTDMLSSLLSYLLFGDEVGLSVSSATGRFQLNQDGLPRGIAISLSCTLQAEGQTVSLTVNITTTCDYSESVKVVAPDNSGEYASIPLSQLLEELANMEIPEPEFPEIDTGAETTPPETEPTEPETKPDAPAKVLYVTADALWVRSSPVFTGDGNKIGLLYKGDKIEVIMLTDSYCSFLYNGSVAYVGVRYLSETPPAQ